MAQITERVARMMKNFIAEWKSGKNIPEIALKYKVGTRTIYKRLQEIADQNGYQRKELLERPHKPHKNINRVIQQPNAPDFSFDEIRETVSELIAQTKLAISNINEALNN